MSEWTYRRGRWIEHKTYPQSPRGKQANERLRKWSLQTRWKHFPQLGPVPEKWMDVGKPPTSMSAYLNEVFIAVFTDPFTAMINEPTPLMKYLEKK